jgi:hypothetical protein
LNYIKKQTDLLCAQIAEGARIEKSLLSIGYKLQTGVQVPAKARIFLFAAMSRPALGPTQPLILWVPGVLFLGLKQLVCEADYSPASGAEINNVCEAIPPLFHISQ